MKNKIFLVLCLSATFIGGNVIYGKELINDKMDYLNVADMKDRGNWKISGDKNTITPDKYVKIIMDNGGEKVCDYGVIKEFSPYAEGIVSIDFDFMQSDEKSNCRIMDLRGYQESKNSNTRMVCFLDISEGNVILRGEGHSTMGDGEVVIENYSQNEWYNIKAVIKTSDNSVSLYINNELKAELGSLQSFDSISAIKFGTNNATDKSQEKANGANVCIDNVCMSYGEDSYSNMKKIAITGSDDGKLKSGELVASLDVANRESVIDESFLLYTALCKNGVIDSFDMDEITLSFGKEDVLETVIDVPSLDGEDEFEVNSYLFYRPTEGEYILADAQLSIDSEGTTFSEDSFSTEEEEFVISNTKIDYLDESVVVDGNAGIADKLIMAFVYDNEAPDNIDFDTVKAIFTAKSAEDGSFSLSIPFGKGLSSGTYGVLLHGRNADNPIKKEFTFISTVERELFMQEIVKLAEQEDVDALKEYLYLEKNRVLLDSMNILTDAMSECDGEKLSGYIISKAVKPLTSDSINEAIAFCILASAKEENIYSKLLEFGKHVGINDIDETLFADTEIKKQLEEALVKYDYDGADNISISEYYNITVSLIELNNATFDRIEDILIKYNDIFCVDFSDYDRLSDLKQSKVMKEIAERNFDEIEKYSNGKTNISTEFDEIVEDIRKEQSSSSGGKGGSSGGGGGSGNGGSNVAVVVKKDEAEAVKESVKNRPFKDIDEKHWAYEDIYFLYDNAIISGIDNDTVAPDKFVKREEFVKMIIASFFEIDVNAEGVFSDVTKNDWFSASVNTAAKLGLVYGDRGTFGTGEEITRQDAIVILKRVADRKGTLKYVKACTLTDMDDVSEYAKESVRIFAEAGVVNGDENGKANPDKCITRAEAARLIRGIIQRLV